MMAYVQVCKQRRPTAKHFLQNGSFVRGCVLGRESSIAFFNSEYCS